MGLRVVLAFVAIFVALYFGAAAYVLRYELSHLLFPHVGTTHASTAEQTLDVVGSSGNSLLVRRYGDVKAGCVVFFPGQHGGIAVYERTLFPSYVAEGLAVFALAYPGQDGAAGHTELNEIQSLTKQAIGALHQSCAPSKTVLVGRSLGAMLAAYSAGAAQSAGLLLEGAAPSLSSAITARLRSRWFLSPLAYLPVSQLLAHDYSLAEGLSGSPALPVVIFQGTADEQTPIEALRAEGVLPANTRLVPVVGGTHADTSVQFTRRHVDAVLSMLLAARTNE